MDSTTLLGVTSWAASKKTAGNCVSAINALRAVGDVRDFLHRRRTLTGLFSQAPIVDECEWLKFYSSPKSLERKFLEAVSPTKLASLPQ